MLNDNGKLAVELIGKLLKYRDQMIEILQANERSKTILPIGSCAPVPIIGLRHILKELHPDMQITDYLDSNHARLLDGLQKHEFSLIVLNHSVENEKLACIELFEERLYLSVPLTHPLALYEHITFDDLNGESVLLFSKIGFWNEICLKMIPNSHLLIQEDQSVFQELMKASALPNFKSNITILREDKCETKIKFK